jgi:6,7-dimethyl-8-ribityllumazine synthase
VNLTHNLDTTKLSTVGFSFGSSKISLDPTLLNIGIVVSTWNSHITDILLDGAIKELIEFGISKNQIHISKVPGAFELPLGAQWHFNGNNNIDAVLCLGCVIKGDTPHFDFVCTGAMNGIMDVGLKFNKPCIFGVVTTNTEQQAFDRTGGSLGNKGSEAAQTALQLLSISK